MKKTRHVPKSNTQRLKILTFEQALLNSQDEVCNFDKEKWIYIPNRYEDYRYILGTRGNNPLITIGANPSTASPELLDPTLQSVQRIALNSGYDSFLMLNVYPQRSTDPKLIEGDVNGFLVEQNVLALKFSLLNSPSKDVWCAWGNVIEARDYMKKSVAALILVGKKLGAHWFCAGVPLKSGNPHHPLYLKAQTKLKCYNPSSIFDTCEQV